jgi:uncharacterized protein YkwD
MSIRPASWLAPVALVLALGAGAGLAIHSPVRTASVPAAQSTVRGATVAAYGAADLQPANQIHSPLGYTPPPRAVTPSQKPRPGSAVPPRAAPSVVVGSYQQALINRDRAAAGLPPLTWSSCLASVAVANAVRLSRQGWVQPYHTNGASLDLGCHLGRQAGENVGYWSGGINDGQLNTMFMNSPEHRANIMGPYHYVATAWAIAPNGYAYIAVEFS